MIRALACLFALLASATARETELDGANWAEGTCEGDCDEALLLQVQAGRRSRAVQAWLTAVDSRGKAQFVLRPQPSLSVLQAEASDSGGVRERYARRAQPGPTQHCETVGGSSTPACTIIPPQDGEPEPTSQSRAYLWQANATMLAAATTLWDGVTRVSVDVSAPLQTMRGFGAAMTHSSAIVLQKLKKQDADLYAQVMQRLFGLGDDSAGISLVRFPLGSSDYAEEEATFNDLPQPSCNTHGECATSCSLPGGACSVISGSPWTGQAGDCWSCGSSDCSRCTECQACCCVAADHDLQKFRLDGGTEEIVATLQDAKAINPGLLLMGSPWTPPRWLKQWGTLEGKSSENTIIDSDDAYSTYAKYLLKVTEVFADRGLPLAYLTLQNEPLFAPSYPGMYLSATNYARLGKKVKALFGSSPKILIYDHNWDHPEYPEEGIKAAPGVFSGTAYHCYAGNMADAQERTHGKFPDLDIIMTECTGSYSGNKCDIRNGMDGFGWNHQWDMDNLFLGNAVHWGSGGIKWVMALDETCGPVLPTMSFLWGRPLVSIPRNASSMSDINFNQDFWTVAHMGRFVRPGAERVQATITAGGSNSIIGAFRDESAGTVTLMAVNKDHSHPLDLEISYDNLKITRTIPAWGTAVLVWPK